MKTAHILVKGLSLFSVFALVILAMGPLAMPASASVLQSLIVTPADTRPSTSTTHAYQFTIPTGTDIEEIVIQYCTTASGGCTKPSGLTISGATLSAQGGTLDGTWTLEGVSGAAITLQHPGGNEGITANELATLSLGSITNHAIDDCEAGGDTSADTCFIRIVTYEDLSTTSPVDNATATYTVVAAVTVTATVDPTFTFVVSGVDSDIVNSQITTTVSSAYNTMPFGNLTAGTPRYGAHSLAVTTNTQNGYTVSSEMVTQMAGVYTGNNIDPYAASGVAWGSPTTGWTQPTATTPNTDSGWIGMNTTDTDISGWSTTTQRFGPVNGSANTVMSDTDSDDGSTAVYVTYGIGVNVFQPADTYTGTIQYTALPTY